MVLSSMSLQDLFDLTENLDDAVTSPGSHKAIPTTLFWTIVVVVAGCFVFFGWLIIHGHLR